MSNKEKYSENTLLMLKINNLMHDCMRWERTASSLEWRLKSLREEVFIDKIAMFGFGVYVGFVVGFMML